MLRGEGSWTEYRRLPGLIEVDFHVEGQREIDYHEAMALARAKGLEALRSAFDQGHRYVMFTHGSSTSGPGRTTIRSTLRELLRSKDSTPFVNKAQSIQHESVLVAAIHRRRA